MSSQASLVGLAGHISIRVLQRCGGCDDLRGCAGTGQIRHPRQRGEPDRGDDPDVGLVLGPPDIAEPFLSTMPLHRWATEDDIAAPIVFLLSDGAAMISVSPCRSMAASPRSGETRTREQRR